MWNTHIASFIAGPRSDCRGLWRRRRRNTRYELALFSAPTSRHRAEHPGQLSLSPPRMQATRTTPCCLRDIAYTPIRVTYHSPSHSEYISRHISISLCIPNNFQFKITRSKLYSTSKSSKPPRGNQNGSHQARNRPLRHTSHHVSFIPAKFGEPLTYNFTESPFAKTENARQAADHPETTTKTHPTTPSLAQSPQDSLKHTQRHLNTSLRTPHIEMKSNCIARHQG